MLKKIIVKHNNHEYDVFLPSDAEIRSPHLLKTWADREVNRSNAYHLDSMEGLARVSDSRLKESLAEEVLKILAMRRKVHEKISELHAEYKEKVKTN